MIKVYSEHRLNEDWFLRSKGFSKLSTEKRAYVLVPQAYNAPIKSVHLDNGLWSACLSGGEPLVDEWNGLPMTTLEAAFVAAELMNWGQP